MYHDRGNQEATRPILDAFWSWVEKTSAMHTTNEKLTEALTYSINQKKYLKNIYGRWTDSYLE